LSTGELLTSSLAAVDGPFEYSPFNDNDVCPPIDPDLPYSRSSISQPPPDVAVTICEAPSVKKRKACVNEGDRLPEPCRIPALSQRLKAILAQNGIKGNNKFHLLREAVSFYNGLCPIPQLMNNGKDPL